MPLSQEGIKQLQDQCKKLNEDNSKLKAQVAELNKFIENEIHNNSNLTTSSVEVLDETTILRTTKVDNQVTNASFMAFHIGTLNLEDNTITWKEKMTEISPKGETE